MCNVSELFKEQLFNELHRTLLAICLQKIIKIYYQTNKCEYMYR